MRSPPIFRPRSLFRTSYKKGTFIASFSPSDISGLVFWVRGDNGTYQTTDTSTPASSDLAPVGRWSDLSGNENHVTQSVAGSRATLLTAALNGHSVLDFSGGDHLSFSGAGLDIARNTGALTLVFVGGIDTSAGDSRPFGFDTNAAGSVRASVVYNLDGSNAGDLTLAGRRLDADARFAATGTGYADAGWDILLAEFNFTANTTALYRNGSSIATGTTGGAGSTSDTASAAGNLGAAQTLAFDGRIAEALAYQKVLTSDERDDLFAYLNAFYAVY